MGGRVYRFADLELDEARRELRRSGAPVVLQAKAFDLLLHLLRNSDRVVTQEEIYAELWRGVVVTEDSLHKAVSGARRAVGDTGRTQRLIQTVRRPVLRLIAAVEYRDEASAGGDGDLTAALDRFSPEERRVLAIGAIVGPAFDLPLIARVSGQPLARLLDLVERARAAGALEEAAGTLHRFAEERLREALLGDLSAAERARVHGRIGEALEASYGASCEQHLAELARHFVAGAASAGPEKAIAYARRAGEAAMEALACEEAAR